MNADLYEKEEEPAGNVCSAATCWQKVVTVSLNQRSKVRFKVKFPLQLSDS